MSHIVMYDNTKIVTITTAMPRASIPNYLIAANPPPKKRPFGKVGRPQQAAAKAFSVNKGIIIIPNISPIMCPGNKPIGSTNHLNRERTIFRQPRTADRWVNRELPRYRGLQSLQWVLWLSSPCSSLYGFWAFRKTFLFIFSPNLSYDSESSSCG